MTPERTAAPDAAINTHSPPGRTDSRSGPKGSQDLFGAILDHHQARTAVAEGHQEKSQKSSEPKPKKEIADRGSQTADRGPRTADKDSDSGQAAAADKPAAPAADADAVLAAAAAITLTAAPAVVEQPAVPGGAAKAPVAQGPAQPVVQLPVVAEPAVPVQGPVTPAVPAAAAPAPAAPVVDPQPLSAAKPVIADQPAQPQAPQAQAPVLPGNTHSDAQTPGQGQPQQQPAQQAAPAVAAPVAQPVADAAPQPAQPAAPKPAADAAAQVQQQSQAQPTDPAGVQASAAQPTPPSAPQAGPIEANRFEPAPGMRLHQAVETVQAVVKMAQTNGVTRARVALHPEQLGGLEIQLTSTKDGVSARVLADAAQAANVLRHAGEELRRSLESQGINLVRFDVGTAGGEQRRSNFGQEPGSGSNGRTPTDSMEETEVTSDTTQEKTVQLPNGVLVDVLA
jgi:flagellar hook-length control protein FliK